MFRRNLKEVSQIYIPDKFTQRGYIPSKIKYEILAYKGSQTIRPRPEIISLPETANQYEKGASSVIDDGSRFHGKSKP